METFKNVDYKGQYIVNDEFEMILIKTPKVTRELIDYIRVHEDLYDIVFDSEEVIEFCDNAFKDMNLGLFDFSTAANLKMIGDNCFENVFNFYCINSFNNVEKIGKYCFNRAFFIDGIDLPKVIELPEGCFKDSIMSYVNVPSAKVCHHTAFDGTELKEMNFPSIYYENNKII